MKICGKIMCSLLRLSESGDLFESQAIYFLFNYHLFFKILTKIQGRLLFKFFQKNNPLTRFCINLLNILLFCSCVVSFLPLTILLFLASGDRGSSHTTSNSSKESSAGISNTNLHQVVGSVSASTAAANNTTASSATSLMSKALAGFGTGGSGANKPKSSGLAAAIVAQAASENKPQQQHQMAAAVVNNISSKTTGSAALQNSSPISAGRI